MGNLTAKQQNSDGVVGRCGVDYIEITFENLILEDCKNLLKNPTSWYKENSIDKSDASKIRRGLLIPPLYLRLKICKYFNKDSSEIWRREDIAEIRKLMKQKIKLRVCNDECPKS